MAARNYSGNAAATTLTADLAAGATSFSITSGTNYPSANFVLTIDRGTSKEEKVLVGSRTGESCSSVTRGFDSTTDQSHTAGATVEHTSSAADFSEANTLVNLANAKGDIISATAADTWARKAAGTNDQILMADSAQSDGLKWASPATPGASAVADTAAEGTADTWSRSDHRHSREASIGTAQIADDAVTAAKIAADAVGASEIAANAVGTAEIANDAVTADKIAANAVGSSEIAADAVGTSELADGAVDAGALAGAALAGFFEEQVLEDEQAGVDDVAIGSADTQIFVATITLPAGWTSMAVTVEGYCAYSSTGGTPARFATRRESPTSTLLRTGRVSTPGGAAAGIAGFGGPDHAIDVLGTLSANRTYRYSALYQIEGTAPLAGARYFIAKKRRVS